MANNTTDTDAFRSSYFKNNRINERNNFNPYRLDIVDDDAAVRGIPIMFITTPKLNLSTTNIEADEFFKYLSETDPDLLKMLNYGGSAVTKKEGTLLGGSSPFIRIVSNRFSNFTIKPTTSQPREIGETFYGYRQNLPGPLINSLTGDTTSIGYVDNRNIDILKLHKVWLDYIEHVSRGTMKPSANAITNRFIDYTSSIYYFTLDMDGETIQYFQKLTGCSPISVPYDAFSSKIGGNQETVEYSIDYAYSYKEDMDPSILLDFNAISQDGPKVASFDEFSPTIFSSEKKVSTNMDEDYFVDADLSKISNPIIVLEGYGDSDKKRYKLKYTNSK